MPLYDLFRPPLSLQADWVSVHGLWSASITADLNRRLPKRFLAQMQMNLGRRVEADVVEFDLEPTSPTDLESSGTGGTAVAVAPEVYAPPAADLSFPVAFTDAIEIKVYDTRRSRRVVAVIELVSPSNKDRPDERESFARKSLGYLKAGIGLIVIDAVTDMHFNLHDEIIHSGPWDDKYLMAGSPTTYAVAYRPVHRKDQNVLDAWTRPLVLGEKLPTLPLAIMGFGCVPLDLEATYAEACERSRIP